MSRDQADQTTRQAGIANFTAGLIGRQHHLSAGFISRRAITALTTFFVAPSVRHFLESHAAVAQRSLITNKRGSGEDKRSARD